MNRLAFCLGLALAAVLSTRVALAWDCKCGTATKPKDIVDTAVAAGNFKTLAAALDAADLIETLKDNCHDASVIFIETQDLTKIDASGCDAFRKKLRVLKDFCYRLVFMDPNAERITPKWTEYF